jgi:hypothetical protein
MKLRMHLAGSALFLCFASVTGAAILEVPADYPTIQQAVNAAAITDTVLIAPGLYQENILVNGKWILLTSHYMLDGNPAQILNTVLDGSTPSHPDTGSVIILLNATNAVVSGLTLTGGTGTVWLDQSDGLLYREGGGILTEGGAPTIRDNVIIANRATDESGSFSAGGGGIRCGFGTATIIHNVFAYNEALYGGGVVVFRNPSVLRNNIVYENSGGQDYGGAGIWATFAASPHTIANNCVVNNRCDLDGGGILLWANAADLVNNIVRGNTAASLGPQIRLRSGAAATTVNYCNVEGGGFSGTGNLDLDPLFALPTFGLQPGSPCVDAGDPASAFNDLEDSGNPGMALAPALGSLHSDIGADGGPWAKPFPDFNNPQGYLDPNSVDFGTVTIGASASRSVGLAKVQFGVVRVDSLVFVGGGTSLSTSTQVPLRIGPLDSGVLDTFDLSWSPATYGALSATLQVYHGDLSAPNPLVVSFSGNAPGKTGDTNFDGVITSADIIHLVNYVFKGGAPPLPVPRSGDIDCSGAITSADIIALVNYVFKGGAPPCA